MLCQNKLLDAAAAIIMGRGQEPSADQSGRVRLCMTPELLSIHSCATPLFAWPCQVLGASRRGLLKKVPTPWRREDSPAPLIRSEVLCMLFCPLYANSCQPGNVCPCPATTQTTSGQYRAERKTEHLPKCRGAPPQGNMSTGAAGPSSRWRAAQPQGSA